jgi:hypothetical protein
MSTHLDEFKARARATAEALKDVFNPPIAAGEKNIFSHARVLEYQARREGFSCFAAFKASAKPSEQEPAFDASERTYLSRLAPHRFPRDNANEYEYAFSNAIRTLGPSTVVDGIASGMVQVFDVGYMQWGDYFDPSDLSDAEFDAEVAQSFVVGSLGDEPYFAAYAAVDIFPAPVDCRHLTVAEYFAAHKSTWRKVLAESIERQLLVTLRGVHQVMRRIEDKLLPDGTETHSTETHCVLLDRPLDDVALRFVGALGQHALLVAPISTMFKSATHLVHLVPLVVVTMPVFEDAFEWPEPGTPFRVVDNEVVEGNLAAVGVPLVPDVVEDWRVMPIDEWMPEGPFPIIRYCDLVFPFA